MLVTSLASSSAAKDLAVIALKVMVKRLINHRIMAGIVFVLFLVCLSVLSGIISLPYFLCFKVSIIMQKSC
jgi:hypothetical protein